MNCIAINDIPLQGITEITKWRTTQQGTVGRAIEDASCK